MFNSNLNWRHPNAVLLLASIVILGTIVVVSILRERIVNEPQYQINVAGQGRVTYRPDTANINLGVKVDKAPQAEDALKQLNDKMSQVIAAVKKTGIADADVQTQNYALSPHYDTANNVSTVSGYDASQLLIVKVRDLNAKSDLVSKTIGAATKAGVNQVNGVTFENSGLNELKQEARLQAIADARSKSGAIADGLGVKLGAAVGWWENIVVPAEAQVAYKSDTGGLGGGATAPEIPTGAQELVIEVNVSYKIK